MCRPGKEPKVQPSTISFLEEKARHVQHPHDNALVITAVIAYLRVHRVLINNRSSINIIFKKALDQLWMGYSKIKPVDNLLVDFIEATVLPFGMIDLPFCLKEAPNRPTQMETFIVMDQPSATSLWGGRLSIHFEQFPSPTI